MILLTTLAAAAPWPDLTELRAKLARERQISMGRLVLLTQAEFDGLLRYDSTVPTGIYVGKRWKRYQGLGPDDWLIGAYIKNPKYTGAWKVTPYGEVPSESGDSPILLQWSDIELIDCNACPKEETAPE